MSAAVGASRRGAAIGLTALTTLLAACPASADTADFGTPVGRWQTFDEQTQAPRGMVRIYEKDGKLFGRIERTPAHRNDADVCSVCTDDRKNQPIDGLVIIRNMDRSASDPAEWTGGDVLDPDTGKLYRFKMRVEDGGNRLAVRGFLGVSLIGRTQTWSRVP